MLEETFLPTHLRLRKDFNYSYTNLLIIHKARHLSALFPIRISDTSQAYAVHGFFKCYQSRLLQSFLITFFKVFYDWLEIFFPSNKFQVWEKAILEKGNYIWFQIQYKQRKTMYMQSSISIWLVHVWLTSVISKSFLL